MHSSLLRTGGLLLYLALILVGCGGQATSPGSKPGPNQPTTLQLSVSATTGGTVTSTPSAINCGQTCTANFNSGTTVTLTATPNAGNSFSGWSGACSGSSNTCSLVLNKTVSVGASFTSSGVALSVSATGSGSGTIASNPAGINCANCTASFAPGTTVTLTANPTSGSNFAGWSGACSGGGSCTVTLSASTSVTASFSATLQSVNHIIFMAQENRGFLEYFGALPEYWSENGYSQPDKFAGLPQFANPPGATPAIPGCDPSSPPPGPCIYDPQNLVQSYHTLNKCTEGTTPAWAPSHYDFNYKHPTSSTPTLDGFVIIAATGARNNPGFVDVDGQRAMGYFTGDDLNYYYYMASNFATSDAWFSPVVSDTPANRMYLLAATSEGHVKKRLASEGLSTQKTIFEALQDAGISWRVYVTDPAPTLIAGSAMAQYAFSYKFPQNFVPAAQFKSDAMNGTLPQVAMIEPGYTDGTDEHPFETPTKGPGGSVQKGATYVSGLINSLMQSQSWHDSAFILTFDEFGGFYDNVPPQPAVNPDNISPIDLQSGWPCFGNTSEPTCDFKITGYRVPLIVVSPFTKQHFVSHTPADATAILKLVETRFDLPSLTMRDAAQMDMTEFFDFSEAPWSTPPTPPTQFLTGPCNDTP